MSTIDNSQLYSELGYSNRLDGGNKDRLGQEDFLNLMTVQLANQDPFKPMESGDFLGQLAQFGTVSGIEDLQKSFETMASSLSSNQALQASSLLDRDVLVPTQTAPMQPNGTIRGAVELPYPASEVAVGVYDQAGQLVRRMTLGPQNTGFAEFTWDGLAEDGSQMPQGTYQLRAEVSSGGSSEAADVMVAGRVESVLMSKYGGGLTLDVNGLGNVAFADVRKIG